MLPYFPWFQHEHPLVAPVCLWCGQMFINVALVCLSCLHTLVVRQNFKIMQRQMSSFVKYCFQCNSFGLTQACSWLNDNILLMTLCSCFQNDFAYLKDILRSCLVCMYKYVCISLQFIWCFSHGQSTLVLIWSPTSEDQIQRYSIFLLSIIVEKRPCFFEITLCQVGSKFC